MNQFKFALRWPIQRLGQPQGFTLKQALIVLVAGVAHAASLAWPGVESDFPFLLHGEPVWWLQCLALGLLAWLLQSCLSPENQPASPPNWRLALLWGWLFGTAWLTGTFGWTFVALHTYGGLPAPLAALGVFGLSSLLAVLYAAVCGLYVALANTKRGSSAIYFASCWLLAELARGCWLSGFGWGAAGYAHLDGPLSSFAPLFGVYGLCAISAWITMALVQALRAWKNHSRRGTLESLAVMMLILATFMLDQIDESKWSNPAGSLSVTLLQGNIPQNEKFETGTGVPMALQWYAEQLQDSRTSLVIAPETAIPVLLQQLPADYWKMLVQRFSTVQQAALIGIPLGNAREGYTNSVLGLKPGQSQPWRYDKQHLVPFGEFIPPLFQWFTAMMNIPLGDFNRGSQHQLSFEWQGQRLASNICYEDLFGEELAPQFRDPKLAPTIFVNISNLAWFGNSMAMDQHLQIARMRALEFARPFVLATNTGVSAIVDHRARIVSKLARDTRNVLVGEVEGRNGITPYAWWVARFGLWPYWLLTLMSVWLSLHRRSRQC